MLGVVAFSTRRAATLTGCACAESAGRTRSFRWRTRRSISGGWRSRAATRHPLTGSLRRHDGEPQGSAAFRAGVRAAKGPRISPRVSGAGTGPRTAGLRENHPNPVTPAGEPRVVGARGPEGPDATHSCRCRSRVEGSLRSRKLPFGPADQRPSRPDRRYGTVKFSDKAYPEPRDQGLRARSGGDRPRRDIPSAPKRPFIQLPRRRNPAT